MISEVYRFNDTEILLFFMTLMRISAFCVSWPIFGTEAVSAPVKVLFALTLSLVVFPTLQWQQAQISAVGSDLMLLAVREVAIGLIIGYLARFFFFAFRIAGEMISQALGLSSAQLFNPALGGQSTAIEQFYVGLASLFYLAVNGHHYLIKGLVQSFDMVPVARLSFNVSQFSGLGHMTQEVIEIGLQLSAPVVISILVVNMILGVVGKTVPQLNVLVTSFPVNIMVGFGLMIITLPFMTDHMGSFLEVSTTRIFQMVKTF
jgi:flagellar biosynthetic protein FliR